MDSEAAVAAIGLATPWEKLLQTRQGLQPTKTWHENKKTAASLGPWQYTTASFNVSRDVYTYIYIVGLIHIHLYIHSI